VAIPSLSDNALALMRQTEGSDSPEDVFLAWLLSLPDDLDPSDAAAQQLVRLDRIRLRSPQGKRLRELFVAAAEFGAAKGRVS
jgi:hypothetical protein